MFFRTSAFNRVGLFDERFFMRNKNFISASIVLYNCDTEQLKTVVRSYSPSECKWLYLIDNSPVQANIASFLADSRYISYYFSGENRGYGAGHNIAIKKALKTGSKYHVVLNPDLEFAPDVIDKIAEFMDTDDTIAQVMPKVLNRLGEFLYLCKLLPTPMELFFKRFLSERYAEKALMRYQLRFTGYNNVMNVPYLSGCFMFFRTSAFNRVGLFDERFFMYPEDIDITRRMHKFYKTMYYPEVSIVHAHKAESYKSQKMLRIHIVNIIRYFNKWGWFFDRERKIINANVLKALK
jgi:GT2 family glycosyltransferase